MSVMNWRGLGRLGVVAIGTAMAIMAAGYLVIMLLAFMIIPLTPGMLLVMITGMGPPLAFLAGTVVVVWLAARGEPANGKRPLRRDALVVIIVAGVLTSAPAFYLVAGIVVVTKEQLGWQPSDSDRLRVANISYSSRGIKLEVYAPGGIAEVWRSKAYGQRWSSPFQRHYCQLSFRVTDSETKDGVYVLAPYEFHPRREWLLAIKSDDGYWCQMSPYFPDEPNISDKEWGALVAASREVVPIDCLCEKP